MCSSRLWMARQWCRPTDLAISDEKARGARLLMLQTEPRRKRPRTLAPGGSPLLPSRQGLFGSGDADHTLACANPSASSVPTGLTALSTSVASTSSPEHDIEPPACASAPSAIGAWQRPAQNIVCPVCSSPTPRHATAPCKDPSPQNMCSRGRCADLSVRELAR